jgi:hypothetical protein
VHAPPTIPQFLVLGVWQLPLESQQAALHASPPLHELLQVPSA